MNIIKSFKKHFSHLPVENLIVISQSIGDLLSIEQSHCGNICHSCQLVLSQKVFRVLPCWSVTNIEHVKWKAIGFALLFEGGVKMHYVLAIWAPIRAIL